MHFEEPQDGVEYVFRTLLPNFGMSVREEQIALARQLLDALLDKEIALCDAGTGIGKTYAYMCAAIVFQDVRESCGLPFQPIIISTSSIALQEAIQETYLPRLSEALLSVGMIRQPLETAIRKGRQHYICDERLKWRQGDIQHSKKTNAQRALSRLWSHLDIRESDHLKEYDRKRICVPRICDCEHERCRYRNFIEHCRKATYPFQICNHNLLLADAIHRHTGQRPILPDYSAIIMDEAHKLPETARQMFSDTLGGEDIREMIEIIRSEGFSREAKLFGKLSNLLLHKMNSPVSDTPFETYARMLEIQRRMLQVFLQRFKYHINPLSRNRLEKLLAKADIFCTQNSEKALYVEQDDLGRAFLCATVPDISESLRQLLWSMSKPMLLVSGTLAIGESFQRFREESGLLHNHHVQEAVFPSPFDYAKNCLLYFPDPAPKRHGQPLQAYYDALADETARLITVACGHAMVLFTSYEDMCWITKKLRKKNLKWPLFAMTRNSTKEVQLFRENPGSVLLAVGAAWEGFDFPGDCVSMLIIPRLPFPRPNPILEKLKKSYPSLRAFIQAVIVPEMQIKLRQGFGRAIRTETDTCVVAILDERASHRDGYFPDVMKALPEIQCTGSINTVRNFIQSVKSDDYFLEPHKPTDV